MSLWDTVVSSISPRLAGGLASRLGESESAVQRGLETGSATVLSTLASRAGEAGFLKQLLPMISGQSATGVGDAVTEVSESLLGKLFGSDRAKVTEAIATTSGVRGSSASAILSSAAPLVMNALYTQGGASNLNTVSLGGLLAAEAPKLRNWLPAGFSTAGMSLAATATPSAPPSRNWLLPVILVLAILAGLAWWFLGRGTEEAKDAATKVASTTTQTAGAVTDAAKSAVTALGEFFKRKLANGVELSIPQFGVENRLVDFIESSKPVDKDTWFDFDRLLFETGKSTLEPSSQEQLSNVAQIMKSYPKVKMRIGGYTDNVGDKSDNLKLSQDRADNVMNQLVTLGIDKARLDAKGFGEEHPVASNETPEGRAQNRRISMRVTEK